ncbi:ATP-dependent DNA helicase [Aphis craccivora]|uniref:ATP-dependent DNA helicase n=1 Tax=Aphis craccivora TaxID=307492 RepID=A0A6G0YXI1_APHCR|nr:ATP-dependent DNA helicase [Aphis craccivora]
MNQDEIVNYPTEFLKSLNLLCMSPHVLTLEFGFCTKVWKELGVDVLVVLNTFLNVTTTPDI